MGILSGKDESSAERAQNPFSASITWNSKIGEAAYFDQEVGMVKIKGFSGIIVDPNWLMVTGQDRTTGKKVKSSLSRSPDPSENLYVFYTWIEQSNNSNNFKYEKIAEGPWASIKDVVVRSGGKFTRVCVVYVVKLIDENGKDLPLNKLVQFRLRGQGAVTSWNDALAAFSEETGKKEDYRNLDGVFIKVSDSFLVDSYMYPEIKLANGNTQNANQKALIARATTLYQEVQDYWSALKEQHNNRDNAFDDNAQQVAIVPPVVMESESIDNGADDDLPF